MNTTAPFEKPPAMTAPVPPAAAAAMAQPNPAPAPERAKPQPQAKAKPPAQPPAVHQPPQTVIEPDEDVIHVGKTTVTEAPAYVSAQTKAELERGSAAIARFRVEK